MSIYFSKVLFSGDGVTIYYDEFKSRVNKKVKEDVFKAQRMYYLALKLESRVPEYFRKYSMDILNKYTKIAKEMETELTSSELYLRILSSLNPED